ncbi:MAG: hypothetical protein PHP85_11920 [Gallionella sp.]|nr:hypothetical protein [Gallionella sp.]
MNKAISFILSAIFALTLSAAASAATCTSRANGNWSSTATWTCTGTPVVTIPGATDTAVIASPNTVILDNSIPVLNLTVNTGGTLSDTGGRTLTVTGNITHNGIITSSNSGKIASTGAAAQISGNGTFSGSARLYTSGASVFITAGSALNFAGTATIRAGVSAGGNTVTTSVLTINGMINSSQAAGTNMLRLYATNTFIGSTGGISATNSTITYNTAAAKLTNNGSVVIQKTTQNSTSNSWTQGVNSSLTVFAVSTVGTFNASASGNTVTYNGTSTVIAPSAGYWNLAGTIFPGACPVAYPVSGSNPCPAGGPVSVTMNPGTCVSATGIGSVAWTNPANAQLSDTLYATSTVNGTTNYLKCTGYNFAIPATATIKGVTVNVVRKSSSNTRTTDAAMRLVKAGAIGTTDRATTTIYTTTDVSQAHGGTTDLWGVAWTPADINLATFGAAFAAKSTRNRTISVNHMPITVTYQPTVAIDHLRIEHNGLACSGTGAPAQITIKACTDAACTTFYTAGNVTGINMAATGGGSSYTWSPANPQSIASASGGVNNGITLSSSIAATAALSISGTPSPAPVNAYDCYNANSGVSGMAGSAACNLAFSTDSFTYDVPDHTSGTRQVVSLTSCKGSFKNKTRDLKFWSSYTNPATGTLQGAVVAGTGNADCTGYSLLGTSSASPTALSLVFSNTTPPVATFSLCYPDVGNVKLDTRYDGSTANNDLGTVILGNDTFTAKPDHFTVSNIKRTSDNFANPAITPTSANPENDTKFLAAGDSTGAATRFTATVTAKNKLNTVTPNFGLETPPEGAKLTAVLVEPAGGSAGLLTCKNSTTDCIVPGGAANFSSGAATITDLAWSEVGIMQLLPKVADADYLATGGITTPTNSANIGRFYPHHFAVIQASLENRSTLCSGGVLVSDDVTPCAPTFTYMGEQMTANFTLIAENFGNDTTLNYTGAFAKLDPVATNSTLAPGAVDSTLPTNLTARLDTSLVAANGSGSFELGIAEISIPLAITRNTSADGPYASLDTGIAPVDSDGVTTVFDLDTNGDTVDDRTQVNSDSTEMRHGRLKMTNAYGSELLGLSLPLRIEYWNGTVYTTNVEDSLSVVTATAGNYQQNLNAGETTVTVTPVINGLGQIALSAPGSGNNGSVDVTASSYSYLPDSTGRATFGVYGGKSVFIYRGRRGR